MVKLDVTSFGLMEPKCFRVLTAVEMGMKNHEVVPGDLVATLAGLLSGGCHKILKELSKNRLVAFEKGRTIAEGFRLTTQGYDFLALRALCSSDKISSFGVKIGIGKESDVFSVMDADGRVMALKFHRLGRTCFRQVKNKREYHQNRTSASWLYLSRISASNEFKFQKELFAAGFPVPEPIAHNRHAVLMEYVQNSRLLQDYSSLPNPEEYLDTCLDLAIRLGEHGLIHCDLNEFNLLLDESGKIWMIDFPQMVSRNHVDAEMFFDRDVASIASYFTKRFNISLEEVPHLSSVGHVAALDRQLKAAGFVESLEGISEDDISGELGSLSLSVHPDPLYVRKKVMSERAAQEKKQSMKRAIKKGEASAINRRKRNQLTEDWFLR